VVGRGAGTSAVSISRIAARQAATERLSGGRSSTLVWGWVSQPVSFAFFFTLSFFFFFFLFFFSFFLGRGRAAVRTPGL
jgi:hypothetical protein